MKSSMAGFYLDKFFTQTDCHWPTLQLGHHQELTCWVFVSVWWFGGKWVKRLWIIYAPEVTTISGHFIYCHRYSQNALYEIYVSNNTARIYKGSKRHTVFIDAHSLIHCSEIKHFITNLLAWPKMASSEICWNTEITICQAEAKLTEHEMQYFWQCKISVAKLKMLQIISYNFVSLYAFHLKYFN